jgi:hypothetical protein
MVLAEQIERLGAELDLDGTLIRPAAAHAVTASGR